MEWIISWNVLITWITAMLRCGLQMEICCGLRIRCEEVEAALRTTEQSLAKLHKLLDNKPIEYVAMALSGKIQAYCDIEDEMVKGMFGTIVQGYLKKGYNRATAEMMAREFFRYES